MTAHTQLSGAVTLSVSAKRSGVPHPRQGGKIGARDEWSEVTEALGRVDATASQLRKDQEVLLAHLRQMSVVACGLGVGVNGIHVAPAKCPNGANLSRGVDRPGRRFCAYLTRLRQCRSKVAW